MSRSFSATDLQRLYVSGLTTATPPLTLACWFKLRSTTAETLFGTTSTYRDNELLEVISGGLRYQVRKGAAIYANDNSSSGAIQTGIWYHAAAVARATNYRLCYNNGVAGDPLTTDENPANDSRITIGARWYNTSGWLNYLEGEIAHPCYWNTDLSTSEIVALYNGGRGMNPQEIRPNNIVAYWPLEKNDSDYVGGYNLTAYNGPTFTASPPLIAWNKSYGSKGAV